MRSLHVQSSEAHERIVNYCSTVHQIFFSLAATVVSAAHNADYGIGHVAGVVVVAFDRAAAAIGSATVGADDDGIAACIFVVGGAGGIVRWAEHGFRDWIGIAKHTVEQGTQERKHDC